MNTEPTDGMKKAWFVNALPKTMQFWVKNQKPDDFEEALVYADSYIDSKASDKSKKKKKEEEDTEEEDSEEERKKKRKKKKKKSKESSSSSSSSEESAEDSESEDKTRVKSDKRAKELEKRLKGDYDTKMDAISSQLHALSLQFTEEETKKRKAGIGSAYAWCTRCFQSGHAKENCPAMKVSVNKIDATNGAGGEVIEHYLESEMENVYTIGGAPKDLTGRAVPNLPLDANGKQKSYTLIADATIPPAPYVRRVPICYNCGEPGHTSYTCPKPRRQGDGKGAKLCTICQMEGHLSHSCPVALAAKTMLMSMGGAAAKTVAHTESPVRLITVVEADDEASDSPSEKWEYEADLPGTLSDDEDYCFKVSTRTERRLERLKKLKDKRKLSSDEDMPIPKVGSDYDREHPSLFFPTVTEEVKQQLAAEEKREADEAMKKDLVIASGLRTIDLLTHQLGEIRNRDKEAKDKITPPPDEVGIPIPKVAITEEVIPKPRDNTTAVSLSTGKVLPTKAEGEVIPFNIQKEVWNCPVHTTVGALLTNHTVFQKELKGLLIRKRRRRLPVVSFIISLNATCTGVKSMKSESEEC
ncbi:unnamed protein product [Calypogeia fissa]